MLATLIMVAVACHPAVRAGRGLFVLAGLLGGAAAWTKNEGILFALIAGAGLAIGRLAQAGLRDACQSLGWFALGALPMAVCVVIVKLTISAESGMFPSRTPSELVAQLTDPTRHERLLRMGRFLATQLPGGVVLAGLAGLLLCLGPARRRHGVLAAGIVLVSVGLMVVGYGLVYLITPYDLAWHLNTSAGRLFVQLWPSLVLGVFLLLRPLRLPRAHSLLTLPAGSGSAPPAPPS